MSSQGDNKFGEWLRAELSERGWSYPQFARVARISDGAVKRWVQGQRNISELYADRVADALKVSRNFVRDLARLPPTDEDPIVEQSGHSAVPEFFGADQLTIDQRERVQAYIDGMLQGDTRNG